EGSLEAPGRLALWPKLAAVNAGLNDHAEAAICWLNGLWERGELPADWLKAWLASESEIHLNGQPTTVDLERVLSVETPSQGDMRRLASAILLGCAQDPPPDTLMKRLPDIRRCVERHEFLLGVRAAWLVWLHLTRVSGDVLGLARVRDRLIQRLL